MIRSRLQQNGFVRRFVAAAAVGTVAAAALTACSSSGASGTTSITIGYQTESGTPQPFHEMVASFEKANPKIKVQINSTPIATYNSVIATQLQAGNAPDLFYTNPGSSLLQPQIKANYVTPLNGLGISTSVVPKGAQASYTSAGKLYAIPLDTVPIPTVVNSNAYTSMNLTPATTQPQLLQQCATVAKAGKSVFQLAGSVAPNVGLFVMTIAASDVYGPNPQWNSDRAAGTVKFATSQGWIDTLTFIQQMNKAGCFQKGAAAGSINNLFSSVAQGKALGLFCPASCITAVQGIDKSVSVSAAAFPGKTAADTRIFSSPSDALALNAKTTGDKQKAAIKFMKYALSADASKTFATEGGNISITQANTGDVPTDLTGISEYLKNQDLNFPLAYLSWPHQSVEDAMNAGAVGLLTGQSSVSKVLGNMDKAWDTGSFQ